MKTAFGVKAALFRDLGPGQLFGLDIRDELALFVSLNQNQYGFEMLALTHAPVADAKLPCPVALSMRPEEPFCTLKTCRLRFDITSTALKWRKDRRRVHCIYRAGADSDDLARVYRFDLAQDSEMISPTLPI